MGLFQFLDVHPLRDHDTGVGEPSRNVILVSLLALCVVCCRYGNTVPRTKYGKIVTMIYAVFGIPVYILYFRNIGQVRHPHINTY